MVWRKNKDMTQLVDARQEALKIIYRINEKGAFINIALNKVARDQNISNLDRALITELVYGTIRWRLTLDWVINKFSNRGTDKIHPWVRNILRMSVYQILYLDRVPSFAACNEAVNLAKSFGPKGSEGFVNAILRALTRNKGILNFNNIYDKNEYLSVKYSHPIWLVNRWAVNFGQSFTKGLLKANNSIPPLTIRINTLKTTKNDIIDSFGKEGLKVSAACYLEEALEIKNNGSLEKLPSYKQGLFQPQDEASMLVSRVLTPKPGQFIIDVCAAPGGKSTHIAQLMNNKGKIISRDIHKHRLQLIEGLASRLGIKIIETQKHDAKVLDEELIEKADGVLVDAPCTGTGIIRRKPDIKWKRQESDLIEMTRQQKEILNTSAKYVKRQGCLVYSTCSLEVEENERIIEMFMKENEDFILEDLSPLIPAALKKESKGGFLRLFPHIHKTDGFFITRLRRL